jgi:hypothetical protein
MNVLKKMKINLFLAGLFFLLAGANVYGQSILEQKLDSLSKLFDFSYKRLPVDGFFSEKYLLEIKQPLNHDVPSGKTFVQRVFLSHKGFDNPVVFVTEGYWAEYAANPEYVNELCPILNANQIVVEHRFFPPSVPDTLDWRYLTVEQSAADHHNVVEVLKNIYKGKWISTGISKGGQACIFFRYLYPEDVDISVPYVAPLNFSTFDTRINRFLDTVGSLRCRKSIRNYQTELLSHREKYLPYFKKLAGKKGYTYGMGFEKAFDLMVFEYRFAFWQWGQTPCDSIARDTANPQKMIEHLDKVADISWVSDQNAEKYRPFFYEAMKQIGMYGYDISPFKNITVFDKNPDFAFTLPKGAKEGFDPSLVNSVDCFIRHRAKNMMFIVGGSDPWGATSVNLSYQNNLVKFVKPYGSHRTRINNLPSGMRQKAVDLLKKWLEE